MSTTVGVDVSKGYVDVVALSPGGEQGPYHRFDDTPAGHRAWWAFLDELAAGSDRLLIGVESTGGLERNWQRSVSSWAQRFDRCGPEAVCNVLDPRAVHRFAASLPTRIKTDPSSASAIAAYYRTMEGRLRAPEEAPPLRGLFRSLLALQGMGSRLVNQIKSLLPEAQPSLVACTHKPGLPVWILRVLERYPTNEKLARAHVTSLAKIPHVTKVKATRLIARAKATPAAAGGALVAQQMQMLVRSYRHQLQLLNDQWGLMEDHCRSHPHFGLLQTIPGIGAKTACAWIAELPAVEQFANAKALVAFIGLDPVFEQSGDGVQQKGISHRGPSGLRQLLYMAASRALSVNPSLKRFYSRLRGRGKRHDVALTACMAKLVRIAYACLVAEAAYDPKRAERDAAKLKQDQDQGFDRRAARGPLGRCAVRGATDDTEAPVSPRERRRRRTTQAVQTQNAAGGSTRSTPHRASSPAAAERLRHRAEEPSGHTS